MGSLITCHSRRICLKATFLYFRIGRGSLLYIVLRTPTPLLKNGLPQLDEIIAQMGREESLVENDLIHQEGLFSGFRYSFVSAGFKDRGVAAMSSTNRSQRRWEIGY